MKKRQYYYINVHDSHKRCPCAKCGARPVIAKRSDENWIGFCVNCDLTNGFDGLNPKWFRVTKEEATFLWSARQLAWDILNKIPQEIQ